MIWQFCVLHSQSVDVVYLGLREETTVIGLLRMIQSESYIGRELRHRYHDV